MNYNVLYNSVVVCESCIGHSPLSEEHQVTVKKCKNTLKMVIRSSLFDCKKKE